MCVTSKKNLKPRLCRVYSSYQDCKDVDDYYPYDGEEGDYGEEEEAPKPPTPPNIEKIKKYLAENVPGLDKGEFNDESHRELLHTVQPDQNGNCAETLVHWYPEDPKGNKWTIYVIGRNAVASNKFMTFTYTSSGITPSTKEKELNHYDELGQVSMYDGGIFINYYIDNDCHQDEIYYPEY